MYQSNSRSYALALQHCKLQTKYGTQQNSKPKNNVKFVFSVPNISRISN